jgi:hypothetical protein
LIRSINNRIKSHKIYNNKKAKKRE